MASIGSLIVDLGLQSAQFLAGLRNAQNQAGQTGKAIASAMNLAKGAIGGLVGVLSIDFLKNQAHAAFDYADAIVDLSDRTSVTTKTIQEFRYAAQLSGSSVESADAALDKFTKNMGGASSGNKALAKSFAELGVNVKGTADEALKQFMDGIAKLPTVAQRNAAATSLMGKSANDLTALLGQGSAGFIELASAAQKLGIVMEDDVLRNAGQVNDKLDALQMIVTAQMANAFVQNADAIALMVEQLIRLASAAGNAVASLSSDWNMNTINRGYGAAIKGWINGRTPDEERAAAKADQMRTHTGREAFYEDRRSKYNALSPQDKKSAYGMTLKAEMHDTALAEARYRQSLKVTSPKHQTITLPSDKKKSHGKTAEQLAEEEARRVDDFNKSLATARDQMLQSQLRSAVEVSAQADLQRTMLDNAHQEQIEEVEAQVRKKKLKREEADRLKEYIDARYAVDLEAIGTEETEKLAREKLELSRAVMQNSMDELAAQSSLVKSSKDRRAIALRLVDLEFQLERSQLDAVLASETATKAEKDIAQARLAILGKLQGYAVQNAKDQTAGPLEQYLKQIPSTANEVNEQLEQIQVDGLEHLQDGLLGVIKGTESVGSAFKSMVGGILDGLWKIALQQMIIKPLAGLLFGGSDSGSGGGGLFGSIVKSIVPSLVKGARANGGYTPAGTYLVGERGPELATFGGNANVISNAGIRGVMGANDNNGTSINIGNITSNDPEMVRRMVAEGVASAIPMISNQATDRTLKQLRRGRM